MARLHTCPTDAIPLAFLVLHVYAPPPLPQPPLPPHCVLLSLFPDPACASPLSFCIPGAVVQVVAVPSPVSPAPAWSTQTIPTNVGPTPYCAHVAETCLKFAVGQFSGRVTMSNVHAALPTEVKQVKTRMYLRPIRGRSRWPRGQRVANGASVGNLLALGPTGSVL